MCINHEHRYRINMVIDDGREKFDLVVNAHNVTEAISKADGYAFEKYPGKMVSFTTFHMGYSSKEMALEHGANLAAVEAEKKT